MDFMILLPVKLLQERQLLNHQMISTPQRKQPPGDFGSRILKALLFSISYQHSLTIQRLCVDMDCVKIKAKETYKHCLMSGTSCFPVLLKIHQPELSNKHHLSAHLL